MAGRALVSRLQTQAMPAFRRPAGARALGSWDALSRKAESDAEAKADLNALKNQWDAVEKDFATYGSKAAPAIDWAHYQGQIEAPGFVDFLKQRYEAIDWGKAVDTKLPESELAADKAEKEALLRDGQAIVKAAEALIAETQAKLAMASAKRTNRDSLVEDVWAKNPKIKEEVLAEIEDHQWFKDTK